MLFVLLQLGDHSYALDAAEVVEILPFVKIQPMLRPPPGVAGLVRYRSRMVPILDLCELLLGRAAQLRLSTRVVIVERGFKETPGVLFGLIAERAVETLRCEPDEFVEDTAFALDPILMRSHRLIRRLRLDGSLVAPVLEPLFGGFHPHDP
jgi:chemotaxis-related protein WspB